MNRLTTALKVLTTRHWSEAVNNLFGTIATNQLPIPTSAGFIPIDGNGGTLDLTGTNVDANWLGLNNRMMQWWAYNYCSPLSAVIDRLAEADTNGRLKFINDDDTIRTNYNKNPQLLRIMRLLKNPNPMQTWEEFNSEQVVLCKIFGFCPVFCLGSSGMDKSYTKYMFNLSPFFCQPQYNYEFDLYDNPQPIKSWLITLFGKSYNIPSEDILLLKDGFVNNTIPNIGLPISKVAGLDYCVSNICAAMEADNVLLKKKGPLGIFSYDPKPDIAGWTPMTKEMQDDIQQDLKKYGLTWNQLQYVVSKTPMKWNKMSFNVRELMTKETVRQGIDGICDRFGYPAELMSGKNATYENRDSAEKFLYQNNIIPFSLRRMARYDYFFGLDGVSLFLDYDHLPVLQEDIMKAGTSRYARSQSLLIDWEAGLIDYNEYRELQNMDELPGMDGVFYPDYIKLHPEMQQQTKPNNNAPTSKDTTA